MKTCPEIKPGYVTLITIPKCNTPVVLYGDYYMGSVMTISEPNPTMGSHGSFLFHTFLSSYELYVHILTETNKSEFSFIFLTDPILHILIYCYDSELYLIYISLCSYHSCLTNIQI